MIVGIGHDLVDSRRIARLYDRFGAHFLERCFTDIERVDFASRKPVQGALFLARRFAAKEAAAKALGTGFRGGILVREIGVVPGPNGAPLLSFCGMAAKRLEALSPKGYSCKYHLSLSDEPPYAAAMVVIEALPYR